MADVSGSGTIGIVHDFVGDVSLLFKGAGSLPQVFGITANVIAAPRVASAETRSHILIRLHFDQAMQDDSNLRATSTYTVVPAVDGVFVFVTDVTPEPTAFPTYVDLVVNEMTGGEGYVASVQSGAGAPRSRFNIALNPGAATTSFNGEGENPTVVQVAAISENRVDVKFSEVMLDNAAIRDVSKYSFDNGLVATSVLGVVGDTVQLVTTDQTPGLLYGLTIG